MKQLFNNLTRLSRKLSFLPRGKIGVILNNILRVNNDIVSFTNDKGLVYICDLRSYTENYVPWTGEYEGRSMDKILDIIPDGNVLDIGANVGYWTINLANNISNECKVFAFEAIKSNCYRIEDHIRANEINNIIIFNIALSDKISKVSYKVSEKDKINKPKTFNAMLSEGNNGNISTETLDEVVKREGIKNISFIKIDVEGFEVKVFKGAKKLINEYRPIVYGEFTPNALERNGDSPKDIFLLFKDYTIFQEYENGFYNLENKQFTRDILLIPNEKLDYLSKNKYISM